MEQKIDIGNRKHFGADVESKDTIQISIPLRRELGLRAETEM